MRGAGWGLSAEPPGRAGACSCSQQPPQCRNRCLRPGQAMTPLGCIWGQTLSPTARDKCRSWEAIYHLQPENSAFAGDFPCLSPAKKKKKKSPQRTTIKLADSQIPPASSLRPGKYALLPSELRILYAEAGAKAALGEQRAAGAGRG